LGRTPPYLYVTSSSTSRLSRGPGTPGPARDAGLLDDVVDAWVEPIAAYAIARGGTADTARADARLGIAVTRGLLLDLLATGNRAAVDAALERHIVQYEAIQR